MIRAAYSISATFRFGELQRDPFHSRTPISVLDAPLTFSTDASCIFVRAENSSALPVAGSESGPPATQAGDNVYMLYGAGPLYFLRFTDEATRVLGKRYIHEMMNLDDTSDKVKEED